MADTNVDFGALLEEIARSAREAHLREERATAAPELPDGLTIQLQCAPAINFALVSARVPVIRRLLLENGTAETLTDVSLSVSVCCETMEAVAASLSLVIPTLEPGQGIVFNDLALVLDPGVLAQIEESAPATIRVQVTQGEARLAELEEPTRILGFSEFFNQQGMQELVAAHILPNHPAVIPVLQTAGAILQAATGDSSLQGYQAGRERVIQIGGAIYEGLRQHGIGYINPPASFEETGQKIRTPDQVLGDRLGTCLDLACTYAACLEQAGLHPLLYFISGHAYAGFFTEEDVALASASVQDRDVVLNLQDINLVIPVETTGCTSGHTLPFSDAATTARRHLQQEGVFRALVDVRRSRQEGVLPLPARVDRDGKTTIIVQQIERPEPVPATPEPPKPVVILTPGIDRTPPRMQQWKAGLLDLSLRNPLLNLKIGRQSMALLVPEAGLGLLEDLLMQGHALHLLAHDGLTELQRARGARTAADVEAETRVALLGGDKVMFVEVDDQNLRRRCRTLLDKARTAEEENGTSILYLTIGSLHWTDPKGGKSVRSPILLMPVRLRSAGRGKPMELIADPIGGTSNNYCLLHKLKVTFNLHIPELEQLEPDDAGVDVAKAFAALRRAIADQGLAMRVDEDATIALLQFGKFRMWKDLDDHWERFLDHPVIRHLVERPGETFTDTVPLPTTADLEHTEVFCPIPCDGAQLEAIIAAASGASFVLEGPPGTGKSQTIANLIANALAAGRRVLFVAEKRAALNVVKARLDAVGLGPFCLDIHGKASSPKALRQQLLASLDCQSGVDMAQWESQRRQLGSKAERLLQYAKALHLSGPFGLSAWAARQRLLDLGDGPAVAIDPDMTDAADRLKPAFEALGELPDIATACGWRLDHPWALVPEGDRFARGDRTRLGHGITMLQEGHAAVAREEATNRALIEGATSIARLRELGAMLLAVQGPPPGARAPEFVDGAAAEGARVAADAVRAHERLLGAARPVREVFADTIFSIDTQAVKADLEVARHSWFLFRQRRVRKALEPLEAHRRDQTTIPFELLSSLLTQAARCGRDAQVVTETMHGALGSLLPPGWDPWQAAAATEAQCGADALTAIATVLAGNKTPGLSTWLAAGPRVDTAAAAVEQLVAGWTSLLVELHLPEERLVEWAAGRPLAAVFAQHGEAWVADGRHTAFLGLRRWCAFLETLDRATAAGLPVVRADVLAGRLPPEEAQRALARGVARAALTERFAQSCLRDFDGLEHGRLVRGFVELQELDASLLRDVVPARLLATRPFKAGQRFGEVAELARNELVRQKGGLSIRALLKKYARAINQLAPCLLMSPDSVAQFLEPGVLDFDLVVFDEASQVPVGDAIGAIGRGKSTVVVGDSRQMPPTSFFGRGTDTEDAPPDMVLQESTEDLDSILSECVGSGLPRVWLSWHYRSRAESLIAFSNAHYYEGRLSSFPAPPQVAAGCGVQWHKVDDGVFDRGGTRTNRVEAEAVVQEIVRRLHDPATSQRSMGVVTFNLEQQELIALLLEERAIEDLVLETAMRNEDPEHRLFVKNLENVQGDERDVILLSVSFARDHSGRMTMNFGPLNRPGGERRWNVAITRAKREVLVFSSINPEDINVERVGVGATGVRHLRAYLEMARDGIGSVGTIVAATSDRDSHRDEIAAALRAAGLHVATDVGLSSFRIDLALVSPDDPDTHLVAVLLDGPAYASRRTVQDRDGLPASVLEQLMRWPATMRIWLPEWLVEPDRVVARAIDLVERIQEERRAAAARSIEESLHSGVSTTAAASPDARRAADPARIWPGSPGPALIQSRKAVPAMQLKSPSRSEPAGKAPAPAAAISPPRDPEDRDFVPYVSPRHLGSPADLEQSTTSGPSTRVQSAIATIVEAEGPIEAHRLGRLVARRFGLERVRTARIEQILRLVPSRRMRRSRFGSIVWPEGLEPDTWRAFRRTPPDCDRPLDEIAPEEVRNAMVFFAIRGISISDEALLDEVATVFRIQRMTSLLEKRLVRIINWTLKTGALRRDGDRLFPPTP